MKAPIVVSAAAVTLSLGLVACGNSGGTSATSAAPSYGPIRIWYSNNAQEVAWGKQMVASWNKLHPSEKVTGQQIPAGAVVRGGHRRRDHGGQRALPDLQHLPGGGADIRAAGRSGAAQRLPRAVSYIQARTGPGASVYKSPDGKYYQLPWKSNPVMIFYNKKDIRQGRHQYHQPAAEHLQRVPGHRQEGGVLGSGEVRHLPGAVE